jgi:cytosine/adenosine deaminase-related metal-dependent hydrolase
LNGVDGSAVATAVLHGAARALRGEREQVPVPIVDGRIAASAPPHAHRIDLRDHLVFAGLINAHDHLHLNALPRLVDGAPFANSYAWIDTVPARLERADVAAALRVDKALRLRHGGLKNLLAGVTCVAHHDPWHAALDDPAFPVALLRGSGWSYAPAGPAYGPPLCESHAATPANRPWMIHLAEGTDAVAEAELDALDALGCLGANSVLVHGVGLREADVDRVIARSAAVVWCPSSNLALLGRTLDPRRLSAAGRLALGTDSRVTGSRDLLEEWRVAAACSDLGADALLELATTHAASVLRLHGRGDLKPGAHADLVVVEDRGGVVAGNLVGLARSEIRAVVRDGIPRIADPDFAEWFAAAGVATRNVTLDGRPKLIDAALADPALLALEPGLEHEALPCGGWRGEAYG